MKNIITSTALVLMMSTSAFAAAHLSPAGDKAAVTDKGTVSTDKAAAAAKSDKGTVSTDKAAVTDKGAVSTQAFGTVTMQEKGDILASEFIGMRVYATEASIDTSMALKKGEEANWDNIGEVNDIVLGTDGTVKAVILGIGGFVGLGEKDVSVTMDQIKIVPKADDPAEFYLVINANKTILEEAPAYERVAMAEPDTKTVTRSVDKTANTSDRSLTGDRQLLSRPDVTRDGYSQVKVEDLTASDLEGARVYGNKDEDVGEINHLVLDDNGQVKLVVLDIGGFLGLGEHQIAVTLDELNIQRSDNDFRVYINSTKQALKSQPEYKG